LKSVDQTVDQAPQNKKGANQTSELNPVFLIQSEAGKCKEKGGYFLESNDQVMTK
jgi:hypothetical protein